MEVRERERGSESEKESKRESVCVHDNDVAALGQHGKDERKSVCERVKGQSESEREC